MSYFSRLTETVGNGLRSLLGVDRIVEVSVRQERAAIEDRQRRFEAALWERTSTGYWAGATGQPINAPLSAQLDTLRNRAEYESANNPLIEGMIGTYTLCCLGPQGPNLRIVSGDDDYNRRRERIWMEWGRHAGSNQQLSLLDIMRLWLRSSFHAGEFMDQLITVDDSPGPIKMRVLPIHAHRLLTPPEFLGDPEVAMGVRRDLRNRRPVCYYVSQPYILGAFEVYTGEYLEIPYRDFLHGFLMNEEDQVRGVPWLAPSLSSSADLRKYKISTQDAARAAAEWGVYLWTQNPDLPTVDLSGMGGFEFKRAQTRAVPSGWQPAEIRPQQPVPNWVDFYKALASEIGRPVNMPLMMLLLDSSGHNLSSARFDGQLFWRGVGYIQGSLLSPQLDRLEDAVATEATLAGALPEAPADVQRQWIGWPKPPSMDPKDDALTERMYMENGTKDYAEVCAEHDVNWEEKVEIRAKINQVLQESGLDKIPGIPTQPSKGDEFNAGAGDVQPSGQSKGDGRPRKPRINGNGKGKPLASYGGQ